MKDIDNILVGRMNSHYDARVHKYQLTTILKEIATGQTCVIDDEKIAEQYNGNDIKSVIQYIRKLELDDSKPEGFADEVRNNIKKRLPAFFPAGYASTGTRDIDTFSGLVCLDFDKVEDIGYLKSEASQNPYTLATFPSISNKGLKVLILLDRIPQSKEELKLAWLAADTEFEYLGESDKAQERLSQACSLVYDPLLYVNLSAKRLSFDSISQSDYTEKYPQKHSKNDIDVISELDERYIGAISEMEFGDNGWSKERLPCLWVEHEYDGWESKENGMGIKKLEKGYIFSCLKCNESKRYIMEKKSSYQSSSIPPEKSTSDKDVIWTTYLDGSKRPISDIAEDAFEVIKKEYDGDLYWTQASIGVIKEDENNIFSVETLDAKSVFGYMCRSATFQQLKVTQKDTYHVVVDPLLKYAEDVLACQKFNDLPKLKAIYHHPVLTKEGKFDWTLGYNPRTELFTPETSHFELEDMSIERATDMIFDLIDEFNFIDDDDKLMALSIPITLLIKDYIDAPIPIFAFSGNAGAGKSLLAQIFNMIITGNEVQERQAPHKPEEWNKVVFTALLDAPEFIFFDNVNRKKDFVKSSKDADGDITWEDDNETLESNALASAVTSRNFTDRLMQTNTSTSVKVNSVFGLSGIGVDQYISQELYMRSVFIRLNNSKEATHHYMIDSILDHVKEKRIAYISAFITIIQNWIDNDKPEGTSTMKRFEKWSRMVSGIWENIGYKFDEKLLRMLPNLSNMSDIFCGFLTENYKECANGLTEVKDVTEMIPEFYAKLPELVQGLSNAKELLMTPQLTPQKINKLIRKTFTVAEYRTVRRGDKIVKCWAGFEKK